MKNSAKDAETSLVRAAQAVLGSEDTILSLWIPLKSGLQVVHCCCNFVERLIGTSVSGDGTSVGTIDTGEVGAIP